MNKIFDGKIMMIRVSRQHILERDTYNTNNSNDRHVNQLITDGDWRQLHIENMNFYEFKELITDNYQLDPDVTEAIRFRFISYRGINRRAVYTTMTDDETLENTRKTITTEDGAVNPITLHTYNLPVIILVEP